MDAVYIKKKKPTHKKYKETTKLGTEVVLHDTQLKN